MTSNSPTPAIPTEAQNLPATSEVLEYGYSHEEYKRDGIGYMPINDFSGQAWFATPEEAEKVRRNDLRWRPATFLISRPKPEPSQRYFPTPSN